jgi:hypothetical protein
MRFDPENRPLDIPPFAQLRTENGVTQLRVGAKAARWVKLALLANLLLILAIGPSFVVLIPLLRGSILIWIVIPLLGALLLLCILFTYVVGLSCLLLSVSSGEVLLEQTTLHLRDRGRHYEIPIADILNIRHVAYPISRLEIDISGPPRRLFFRGRRTAFEVQTADGFIEFFTSWEEPKVAWLVANVNRVLSPGADPQPISLIENRKNQTAVTAGRLYGRSWRQLMWSCFVAGCVACIFAGWYAYKGISSRHWPSVTGFVLNSKFEKNPGSGNDVSYVAEIKYSYEIVGKTYTNDDLGYEREAADDDVRSLIQEHPDGSKITVYYDPSRPSRSIVIPGLGLMHWVLCAISAMPLFLLIPLSKPRTTPAQDALAYKYYKGPIGRERHTNRLMGTVRWTTPREAWLHTARRMRRADMMMSLRAMAITALALWAAHHWIAPLIDPIVTWIRICEIMMAFCLLLLLVSTAQLFLPLPQPPTFSLGLEGINVPSTKHPLLRWSQIASYTLTPDKEVAGLTRVTLHLSAGLQRKLTLPGGEIDQDILAEISARLPQGLPPGGSTPLSSKDLIVGILLTAAGIWLESHLLNRHFSNGRPTNRADWIIVASLFAGPGTWLGLALRKRRSGNQLFALGLVLNIVGVGAAMMTAFVQSLSQMRS